MSRRPTILAGVLSSVLIAPSLAVPAAASVDLHPADASAISSGAGVADAAPLATAGTARATGRSGPTGSPTAASEPRSTPLAPTIRQGALTSYVVNLRTASRSDRLAGHRAVSGAGGRVVVAWPEIGVLVVHSRDARFASKVRAAQAVASAGPTRSVPVAPTARTDRTLPADGIRVPRETPQWDMQMIGADRAHRINPGSRAVTVAVVDSGIDPVHPDLRANIDAARSVGCVDAGRPDRSVAGWRATNNLHGTHVAGTIAAARNGIGVVGVAPGARVASVKVVDDAGMIYPEYAICGVMWAATQGFKIANHSYFVDPYAFWCSDQPAEAPGKEAVARAFAYAERRGVVNVAAAGNAGVDLRTVRDDSESPSDLTPRPRRINSTCQSVPGQLPDVVTVSAVDRTGTLAPFSNVGPIDVTAPGDDVLSTVPGGRYSSQSGTSMAAPYASGVLALLASRDPRASRAQLVSRLTEQADERPCPAGDARCTGTRAQNSYYGHGLVDAVDAVRP